MRSRDIAVLLAFSCCAAAQIQPTSSYSGPSLLTRPQAASNRAPAPLAFRPYVRINGIYDTGLVNIATDNQGNIPSTEGAGVEGGIGAYLYRTARHTVVGLDYKGEFRHYNRTTYYDGSDHFLTLGLSHQPSEHVTFSLRESAGTFSRSFGLSNPVGVFETGFGSQTPNNEIFDNRTNYLSTQGDLTWLKSARLSFNLGGDGFLVRRQSTALYGVTGASARVDAAYRLTRRSTIGVDYRFSHFEFTKAFGGTDAHTVAIDYAWRINRDWEFAARIGGSRVETQSLQRVALDPIVAAILGQSTGIAAFHSANYIPSISGRLSRIFRHAILDFKYSRDINPGNGLFLTSRLDSYDAIYSFSGLRRWNLGLNFNYSDMSSLTRLEGRYKSYTGGAGVTRLVGKAIHLVFRLDARRFDTNIAALRRNLYRASAGVAFSPGSQPLSLW